MPKLSADKVPSYRLHRQSGQAIVTLSSRDFLHGTRASREKYNRLIHEWEAAGRRAPVDQAAATVSTVIAAYWKHCATYYAGPSGHGERRSIKLAMGIVRRLYGPTPVAEFGPLKFKAVREAMVEEDWWWTRANTRSRCRGRCPSNDAPPSCARSSPGSSSNRSRRTPPDNRRGRLVGGLSRRWARSCVYRAFRGNYRLGNGGTDPGRHRGGRRAALSIVPHGRRGKRLHPSVFYRWASSGKNGHVLETVTTPSGRVPTKSGVLRFFAALTGRAPAAATPGQVRRQHAKAEAELDAIGIG